MVKMSRAYSSVSHKGSQSVVDGAVAAEQRRVFEAVGNWGEGGEVRAAERG